MIRKYKSISFWQCPVSEYSECKYWLATNFRRIEFNASWIISGHNSIKDVKRQINFQLNKGENKKYWSEMSAAYCKQQLKSN